MADYTDSGFDAFLSRSIDNLPQSNLDSGGPLSTQTRYDASQLSGAIGDTFRMGGIGLSGKDSTITLNDGQIVVNDTAANNQVILSGGKIDYQNSSGNVVVREGILPDNSVGFRLEDNQGIGIAQFYRDINGITALKIAKATYEVSKAANDQLIFNSSQNIFKIVDSGQTTLTPANTGAPNFTVSSGGFSKTVTLTNPTGSYPAVVAFFKFPFALTSGSIQIFTTNPQAMPYTAVLSAGNVTSTLFWEVSPTTIKFWYNQYTATVDFGVSPDIVFTYYILQETSN